MYNLQSSEFGVLSELNHNELGNPHPQYLRKDYFTTITPTTTNKWSKIMSTDFTNVINPENMFFNILLNVSSTGGTVSGLLSLQGIEGNGFFKLTYLDFNAETKKDYLNMFALYRRQNADTSYTYELWASSFLPNIQLIISPIVNICYPQWWSAYIGNLDYKIISTESMYYSNQTWVDETSIGGTLMNKNSIQNSVLYFNTQSDIGDMTRYYGKIVNVGGVNYNIKSPTLLTPIDIIPKSINVTDSALTTIDVSGNVGSVSLNQGSAVSITDFTNAWEGQTICLYAFNSNITIVYNASKIKLKNAVNATLPTYGYLILRKFGTLWIEVSRSF